MQASPKSPRVEIPGPLTYAVESREFPGWILNANRSGILIASERNEKAGTALLLQVPTIEGDRFDLPVTVMRSAKKRTPVQGLGFALGLQFDAMDDEKTEQLNCLLASQDTKLKLPIDLAREFLTADSKVLGSVIVDEGSDSPFLIFLGGITPFERQAYLGSGPVELAARELIFLRAQLGVFKALIPRIIKDPAGLAPSLVPRFEKVLARLDRTEFQIEETIRGLTGDNDLEKRIQLNELSNRLEEPKVALYREIEKKLPPLASDAWKKVIGDTAERLDRIRSFHRKTDTDAGYHTPYAGRAIERSTEKSTEKSVERTTPERVRKSHRVFNVLMFATVIIISGVIVWYLMLPRLRLASYDIPLTGIQTHFHGDTLVVRVYRNEWGNLSTEDRNKTMSQIMAYMGEKNARGAKILAEDSTVLATVMAASGGAQGEARFTTRIKEVR